MRPGRDSFLWRVFRTRIGLGMVPAALIEDLLETGVQVRRAALQV